MKKEIQKYIKDSLLIKGVLFWQPIESINKNREQLLRLESKLKEEYINLYYVHPMHTLNGLEVFFSDKSVDTRYLIE